MSSPQPILRLRKLWVELGVALGRVFWDTLYIISATRDTKLRLSAIQNDTLLSEKNTKRSKLNLENKINLYNNNRKEEI